MNETPHVRDPAELEGALLVEAQPIAAATAADSTPLVQPAVGIPDYNGDAKGHDEHRSAWEGTLRGRQKARAEIESIQRNNRDAALQVKMERQRVLEANAKAKTAAFDAPPVVELPLPLNNNETKTKATASRPKSEGYEISEYKMGEYETSTYDTSEYKSVYDP